jgi:uncharacterized protein (TIGR03083 family)
MALPRQEVINGFTDELADFEKLLRSLDEGDANRPTRCEGWTVADVAAHVIGTLADIGAGRMDDLGTPEGTERVVLERRGRSVAELADELSQVAAVGAGMMAAFDEDAWNGPAPRDLAPTLGDGVEALWYDAYVHGDDIRAALGRPSERGAGLKASVSHLSVLLSQKEWGPATLRLDGMGSFAVGGGGKPIKGDALAFTLAATGRADPAPLGLDPSVNVYG